MKVFISWSGDYSREVAEKLSVWIPSIIQSVDTFFSPDDIGKGENWNNILSKELNDCNFGIICLTPENVAAPWIHFEAGALAKTLDSHVSSVMLGINPSDVKGPLSRFQNTKFERDDFFKLLRSINTASDMPIKLENLAFLFDALWERMDKEIKEIINKYAGASTAPDGPAKTNNGDASDAVQEILSIVRKMSNSTRSGKDRDEEDAESPRTSSNHAASRYRIGLYKRSQAGPLSDETKQVLSEYLPKGMFDRAISSLEDSDAFFYNISARQSVVRETVGALSELPDIVVRYKILNL